MSRRQTVADWSHPSAPLLATRLELFALEFGAEKSEFMRLLVWVGAAMFFGALAFIVFTLFIILIFWPTELRYWAFALVFVVYGGLSLYFVRKIVRRVRYGPLPFAATLDELRKDLQLIQQLRDQEADAQGAPDSATTNDRYTD